MSFKFEVFIYVVSGFVYQIHLSRESLPSEKSDKSIESPFFQYRVVGCHYRSLAFLFSVTYNPSFYGTGRSNGSSLFKSRFLMKDLVVSS